MKAFCDPLRATIKIYLQFYNAIALLFSHDMIANKGPTSDLEISTDRFYQYLVFGFDILRILRRKYITYLSSYISHWAG